MYNGISIGGHTNSAHTDGGGGNLQNACRCVQMRAWGVAWGVARACAKLEEARILQGVTGLKNKHPFQWT